MRRPLPPGPLSRWQRALRGMTAYLAVLASIVAIDITIHKAQTALRVRSAPERRVVLGRVVDSNGDDSRYYGLVDTARPTDDLHILLTDAERARFAAGGRIVVRCDAGECYLRDGEFAPSLSLEGTLLLLELVGLAASIWYVRKHRRRLASTLPLATLTRG